MFIPCNARQSTGDHVTALLEAGSLNAKARQGRYGVVYLRALAAQAGCGFNETPSGEDVLAIDCVVSMRLAEIRVQVKTTYTEPMGATGPDIVHYATQHWIESWTGSGIPVYYVVVVVPKSSPNWIEYPSTGTLLSKTRAYWTRVDNHDFSTSNRVEVPRANELGADTMNQWNAELRTALGL